MSVSITDRATNTKLVQLATVKSRLGITGSSQDAELNSLIDAACGVITSYLGRDLAYQGYTERSTGLGYVNRYVSRFPLDSTTLTVTADGVDVSADIEVIDNNWGLLYYDDRFCTDPHDLQFDYYAGYKLPGDVSDWAATTAYSVGDFIRSTDYLGYPYLMECTTAGDSGGTEPVWTVLDAGETVTDGTVIWTVREVEELPAELELAAWHVVSNMYTGLNDRGGVASRRVDGFSESYEPSGANLAIGRQAVIVGLPHQVRALLDLWRVA